MNILKYNQFTFKKFSLFVCLIIFGVQFSFAQKINTDSLLLQAYESLKQKEYSRALKQAHLGKKTSPEYLDFQVLIGRVHQLTNQQDSARIYFNRILEKNTAYKEAFTYLINLEFEEENFENAEIVLSNAISVHSENKVFRIKKLQFYQLQQDFESEREYLKELIQILNLHEID
ncbi:hypothetical protein [uncultured Planktosalinus sp.]|uniref:hypothetical protein n=1 Tax=uncultured Planktosalinus sp. TaxID=1810935 RepID=UPI0030DBD89B